MKNTIGKEITLTLFGESHGEVIGCVLDGLPSGIKIDMDYINEKMEQRKAVGSISTARREADAIKIVSGVLNGHTEGTPLTILIENTNVRKNDYNALENIPRPSHADYAAHIRYEGYEDRSGGGHFSGRLTAPIVAAGSILRKALEEKGIYIGTHIQKLYDIEDIPFTSLQEDIEYLNHTQFPVLSKDVSEKMIQKIEEARSEKDSLGGILETVVTGMPAGIGEPTFSSIESCIAEAMFSIPAVKGLEFGGGFELASMKGSQANDAFRIVNDKVITETNHNGGINGGISNGMPINFKVVIKPTPSIAQQQKSINYETKENVDIEIAGRHDPAIVHRARAVVDALTALVLADMLSITYGRKWPKEEL